MVKGTPHENAVTIHNQEDMSGPLVSENVIGVVHDHFINFYLDMDIDSPNNSFVKVNMIKENTLPGQSPRKSYWKAKRHVAKTENDAKIKLKLYDPSEFHVVNPSQRSRLGNPTGYKIVPGGTAASLLDLNDPPQVRSAFTNNQVKMVFNEMNFALSYAFLTWFLNFVDYIIYIIVNMWQIWVTPYNESEQYAGGLLTYQSKGDDTLAIWSER